MAKENGRPVTMSVLQDKLDRMRWEMRALILAAIVIGKFVPIEEAKAWWPL